MGFVHKKKMVRFPKAHLHKKAGSSHTNFEVVMMVYKKLAWDLFSKTGNVEQYLLYAQYDPSGKEYDNGTNTGERDRSETDRSQG